MTIIEIFAALQVLAREHPMALDAVAQHEQCMAASLLDYLPVAAKDGASRYAFVERKRQVHNLLAQLCEAVAEQENGS